MIYVEEIEYQPSVNYTSVPELVNDFVLSCPPPFSASCR